MENHLTQSEFARQHLVTRQAVSQAIKKGAIVRTPDGIDVCDQINIAYLENLNSMRDVQARRKVERGGGVLVAATPVITQVPSKKPIKAPTALKEAPAYRSGTKIDAEILKIQAVTARTNLAIAEKVDELIKRELVKKLFGGMSSTILNLFFPLSDRLSPVVAGICGTTEQETILKIKSAIDAEVMRGVNEFKRKTKESIREHLK